MNGKKSLAAALLVLWAILAALFVLRLDGRAQDDLYITYRYARSLAAGEGFVFNPGERVFGLSEPGLGLLLAAVHAATGADLPRLGTLVYAVALVALAALLLRDARTRGGTLHAALGGTLLLVSSYVWTNHGSAAGLVLALLAAAALASYRRPVLAGLLAGAAAWCRPDALAGAALLGLLCWWEERRFPRRYALAAGAAIAAGLLAAWAWFGTPLPETVAAKRADAFATTGGGWEAARFFWRRAANLAPRHFGGGAWVWLLALGAAGLVPFWRRSGRAGRLLVLYAAVVALAYTFLGVPFFSWYLVPLVAALLYGLAALPVEVGRWIGGRRAAAGVVAGALLAVLLALPVARSARTWARGFAGYGHLDTYRRAGGWLRRHTPPETSVAYVEIGVLGWESERRIVDLMGLVTRAARPYVASRDVAGAFLATPADVVVFHTRGRMRPLLAAPWFPAAFAEVARFADPQGPGWLAIHRRRPGAALPPPRPPRPARPL